jgi:hypothetical protein
MYYVIPLYNVQRLLYEISVFKFKNQIFVGLGGRSTLPYIYQYLLQKNYIIVVLEVDCDIYKISYNIL